MDKKISIILSTYNEATIIKHTIDKIFFLIPNVEIILVDDNSSDGTLDIVRSIKNPNLKFFSRKSRGLASAFLLGLINTTGDYIGWIDSNMPQVVDKFDDMIKKISIYDCIVLSRYVDGGGDKRSFLRILSSKFLNLFCRIILDNEIKDYTSSIFLMKKKVLTVAVPIAYGHGEFFIEFLYRIKKNGIKILEIPYIQPPDLEGSKTASGIIRFFSLGLSYLIRILIIKFRKN